MEVDKMQVFERPLIDAYRYRFEEIQDFFTYDPHQEDSFKKRYLHITQKSYPRQQLVTALTRYNRGLGVGAKTLDNIQELLAPETVAIITGQQAGILTGPLYTVYKALTTIQLAQKLSQQGIPAIPLFWIASEDHDFLEIAGVHFLNRQHEEEEVRLAGDGGRQPIGHLDLPGEVENFLKVFADMSIDTDFKPAMLEKLENLAQESNDLAQWFGRIMAWLLRETGLIFVDALDSELRQLEVDFFLDIVEKNDQIHQSLQLAANSLEAAGFSAQIHKEANQLHLCLIEPVGRFPIDLIEGGYQLRGEKKSFTKEELRQRIIQKPGSVSTNVVTRPLLQDRLFPTLAYVAGPGEIAYFAQYKEIYQLFEMEMPIIYPRASLTLVERSIAKGLDKNQLTPKDIFQRYSEIYNQQLKAADELNLEDKFNQIKGSFIPKYQTLIQELQQLDPKFKKLGNQNLQRIIDEIRYLEEKAYHQHRKNSEIIIQQLEKLKMNLYPQDIFQERRFNIFPYLFKYRLQLIEDLLTLDLLDTKCHHLVYL